MSVSTDGGATWSAPPRARPSPQTTWPSTTPATAGPWAPPARSSPRPTAAPPGTRQTIVTSTADLSGVAFSDANHGWAVGAGGTIIATTDGGATWNPQTSNVTADLSGVAFSDADHGWAVGAGGTIIATSDGGATWNPQTSNVDGRPQRRRPLSDANPRLGPAAPAAPSSPRATAATTWASDTGPLGADLVSCAAGPGGIAYALSSDGHRRAHAVVRRHAAHAVGVGIGGAGGPRRASHGVVADPGARHPAASKASPPVARGTWSPHGRGDTTPPRQRPGDVYRLPAVDHPVPPALRVRRPRGGHERHRRRSACGPRSASAIATTFRLRRGSRLPAERPGLPHRARSQGHDLDQPGRHLAQVASGGVVALVHGRRLPRDCSARRSGRAISCRCAWRAPPRTCRPRAPW